MKVAIAGAYGFVGRQLVGRLEKNDGVTQIVAISRRPGSSTGKIHHRQCNLFNLKESEFALAGVDVAIYLVHSMLPPSRLAQGTFADFDLLIADNFARAAAKQGVSRIIYIGGLIPDEQQLSPHLKSRLEVETSLAARGVPVTTLRAGLIIGAEGSSFTIVKNLVDRLPILLCPTWTTKLIEPVFVDDVVDGLLLLIRQTDSQSRTLDIGCGDQVSYIEMMRRTAVKMNLKRKFIQLPFFTLKLSHLWVSMITGAPRDLVHPLVQSLRHDMVTSTTRRLLLPGQPNIGLNEAITRALSTAPKTSKRIRIRVPHAFLRPFSQRINLVMSAQRLPLPANKDAAWAAQEYLNWLPSFFAPLLRVDVKDGVASFYTMFLPALLILQYSEERSSPDRQLFYIRGGLLAAPKESARLEFRVTHDKKSLLAAIHDFRPTLPWYLYKFTQAAIHLLVMKRFGRHLIKVGLRFSGEKDKQ